MAIRKFICFLGLKENKGPQSFSEKRLVYKNSPKGFEAGKRKEEEKKKTEPKPYPFLSEEDPINKVLLNLDQKTFDDILSDELKDIDVDISALNEVQIERLIEFCYDSGEKSDDNFEEILDLIEEENIKEWQLTTYSKVLLIEQFENDKESMDKILDLLLTPESTMSVGTWIEAAEYKNEILNKIFDKIKDTNVFSQLTTKTLETLINRIGHQHIKTKITNKQKIKLLNADIYEQAKIDFYKYLKKHVKELKNLDIHTTVELVKALINLNRIEIDTPYKKLRKNKFLKNIEEAKKWKILKIKNLDPDVGNILYWTLSEAKRDEFDKQYEEKSIAEAETAEIAEEIEKSSLKITDKKVEFEIGGLKRSFSANKNKERVEIAKKIKTAETPEEEKLIAYKALKNIIEKSGTVYGESPNYYKYKLEKTDGTIATSKEFDESNELLEEMIEDLESPKPQTKKTEKKLEKLEKEEAQKAPEEETMNLDTYNLYNIDDGFKIPKEIEKLDLDDWKTNFDQIQGHDLLKSELKNNFNTDSPKFYEVLYELSNVGTFDISEPTTFEDLLTDTNKYSKTVSPHGWEKENVSLNNAEAFAHHFNFLKNSLTGEHGAVKLDDPETRKEFKAELDEMYDTYISGLKILDTLSRSKVNKIEYATFGEKYNYQLDNLETSDELIFKGAVNLDEIDEAPDTFGKYQIGVNKEVYDDFTEIYEKYKKSEYSEEIDGKLIDELTPLHIVKTLVRAYPLDELIGTHNAVKKSKTDIAGKKGLVITKIPNSFKLNNKAVQELFEKIDNSGVTAKREDLADDEKAEFKTEESLKLKEIQGKLAPENSFQAYKTNIVNQFKEALGEEDYLEASLPFVPDYTKGEVAQAYTDNAYLYQKEINKYASAKGIAEAIFGKPELSKFENGVKTIDPKILKNYLNSLINKGIDFENATNKASNKEKNTHDILETTDLKTTKLTETQIDLLMKGFIYESVKGKIDQEMKLEQIESTYLSENPKIRELQEKLLKKGFPPSEIGNIETKIIGGICGMMDVNTDEIEKSLLSTAVAIPFFEADLGHGFKIMFSAIGTMEGITPESIGANVSMSYEIVKTEDVEAGIGATASVTTLGISGGLGTMINFPLEEGEYGLHFGLGVLMSNWTSGVGAGAGVEYNYAVAAKNKYNNLMEKSGLKEVDEIKSTIEKAAKLKEIINEKAGTDTIPAAFKILPNHVSDIDLLTVYEIWKSQTQMKALEESESAAPIITGVDIGIIYDPKLGIVIPTAAIKIRIGSITLIKHDINPGEDIAKKLSQYKITKGIQGKLAENESGYTFYKSSDVYITGDGKLGIITGSKTVKANKLEGLKDKLKNESIYGTPVERKDKNYLKLSIFDTEEKDLNIYIDRKTQNELGIILEKDGSILLGGNSETLVISRETFLYPYAKGKGKSASVDVIVITNDPNFKRDTVIKNSHNLLEKNWENEASTKWTISEGVAKYEGTQQIFTAKEFDEKGIELENYPHELTQKEWTKIKSDTEDIKGFFTPIEKLEESKRDMKKLSDKLYKKMEKKIEEGKPDISNYEGIIKKANEHLAKEQKTTLSAPEANDLYAIFINKYFIDLRKKGKTKEAIIKKFKEHNEAILDKVIKPKFKETILKLGIKTDAQKAEKYAEKLAVETLYEKMEENFLKALEIESATSLDEAMTKIQAGTAVYSGTSVRKTKVGKLAGAPFSRALPNIDTIGIIGNPDNWNVDKGTQENKDIAKIILEITSPSPENTESMYRPFALKLAAFEGTRIKLGEENYQELKNFYNPKIKTKNINSKGVQAFMKFAKEVRQAQFEGKEKIKITNTMEMAIAKPQIQSGAYGKCGNLSLMLSNEGFGLLTKGRFIVHGTVTPIFNNSKVDKRLIELVLGIAVKFPKTPEKPEKIPPKTKVDTKDKAPGKTKYGSKGSTGSKKGDTKGETL